MKKILYTVLSILSIIYIAFLIMDVLITKAGWQPDMGGFAPYFDLIVRFGGVAIIFCFALVNFTGNPLKMVFFLLLIVAIIGYIIVLSIPDLLYNWINGAPKAEAIIQALL